MQIGVDDSSMDWYVSSHIGDENFFQEDPMPRIPDHDIDRIKRTADLVAVIKDRGVTLRDFREEMGSDSNY